MAVAVEIRHTTESPTCRKSGTERATNKNVVIQMPDRCLTRRGIVKDIVWFPVAVKVSHYSHTSAGRRGSWCRRRVRHHDDCAYHTAACPMHGAIVRKRPGSVEGVSEHSSLVENSRVPHPVRHPRRTRGTAVSARTPHPEHRIAGVNRDGRRCEKESAIANHHCDCGSPCDRRV